MKSYKILTTMLVGVSATLFLSCQNDEDDIFDSPTTIRIQETLDKAKKVLSEAPNGWIFDYYPDRDLTYGGYVYTLKFDDQKVTVGSELDPGTFETSYYRLDSDNGPMLSFDTYNTLMHFFATPSSSNYEAYDGDFEFNIIYATPEEVKLKGKRTGNIMYMHPLEGDAGDFINAVYNISDNMVLTSASGTAGTMPIEASINLDTRHMDISWGEGDEMTDGNYFLATPTGIRFKDPVKVGSATVSALAYDKDAMVYSGTDSEGNTVTLAGTLPEDYTRFEEFEGEFKIFYYMGRRSIDVTLVPDKANNRFFIQGLNPSFEIVANYIKSKGYLEINSQPVAEQGGNNIWMCAWALDPAAGTGNLTWDTTAGMYVIKDTENPGVYQFTTNNNLSYNVTSFIMWTLTSSGQSLGQASAQWGIAGSTQFVYLTNLVKQ